jgi:hypothetical protein
MTDKTYFELRQKVRHRYMGPITSRMWDKNFLELVSGGWKIRVFLNGKEIHDGMAADPCEGTVTLVSGVTLRGSIEIRLEK